MATKTIKTDLAQLPKTGGARDVPVVAVVNPDGTPISGGGGSGGGAVEVSNFPDVQQVSGVNGSPVDVHPVLVGRAQRRLTVAAGVPLVLPDIPCKQISIANRTNHDAEVIDGGEPFDLFARSYYTLFAMKNANELTVSIPEGGEISIRCEW